MNVRDTLYHGDTFTYQTKYRLSTKKRYMGRTRICTDKRTDRVISIYPLNFVHGRYNERKCVQADILQAQAWLKSAVHNECQMPCISNGQLDRKS